MLLLFATPLLFCFAKPAFAGCPFGVFCREEPKPLDFADLPLDDMLNVMVTSVSKHPESLRELPAAVYVLTGDEIRESGATSLGDALRIVPGLDVAQIDGSRFAISARGFHHYFSTRMLVLVDGRAIYFPLWTVTPWEQWDVFLDDIERIEVIRGPGGTAWGLNAVNGVINIITKSAKKTTGLLVRQANGTDGYSYSAGRWGGRVGENLWYRGVLYHKRDSGLGEEGPVRDIDDGSVFTRGGFRLDGDWGARGRLTALGEYSDGKVDQVNAIAFRSGASKWNFDDDVRMGHFLVRFDKDSKRWGSAFVQGYYDRVYRRVNTLGGYGSDTGTLQIEAQHRVPLFSRDEATWGISYTWYDLDVGRSEHTSFGTRGSLNVLAARIEDQHRLGGNLKLGLGTKIENNSFTGTELEPRAQLTYAATPTQTIWASVSRAIRIPSIIDDEAEFKDVASGIEPETGLPVVFTFKGPGNLGPEKLIAYEAGWRGSLGSRVTADLALFFNDYDDVIDFGSVAGKREVLPTTPPTIRQELGSRNASAGYSFGGEILWRARLTSWWSAEVSYSFEKFKDTVARRDPAMPDHKLNLRQRFHLPFWILATASLHWVDDIQSRCPSGRLEKIDDYFRFDLALRRWFWNDRLLVEVAGQNLIEGKHKEFFDESQTGESVALGRRVWAGVAFTY